MDREAIEDDLERRGFDRRERGSWTFWLSASGGQDPDRLLPRIRSLAEAEGGRGERHGAVELSGAGRGYLKQFHRGGILAEEGDVHYADPVRFLAAGLGVVRAGEAGVPTPPLIGVIAQREAAGYRGFLLTEARALRLFSAAAREGRPGGFRRAGELLARLHEHGVDHGDYQLKNLHLDGEGRLNVVDFDPVRFRAPSAWTREWRIHRFGRSLSKYGFCREDRRAFEAGYEEIASRHVWLGSLQAPVHGIKNRISDLQYRFSGRPFEPLEAEKILIRAPNWVGDAVMSLPTLQRLRDRYPDAVLDVVCRSSVADVYRHHDDVRKVLELNGGKSWRFPDEVQHERYSTLLVIPKSLRTGLQAWRSGIPRRIGFAAQGRSVFFTDPVPLGDADRRMHHARLYVRLLGVLDEGENSKLPSPRLTLTDELRRRARELTGEDCVVFHPGSAYGPAKRWPARHFARLGTRLIEETDLDVAVLGVDDERELAEEILADLPPERTRNLAGRTDLSEAMGVLGEASACVANDSGLMHLAAALGTPTVGLFGSSDPELTAPLGDRATVMYEGVSCSPCFEARCPLEEDRYRCLTRIDPAGVFEELAPWLNEPGTAREPSSR